MARNFDGSADYLHANTNTQMGNGTMFAAINPATLPGSTERDVIATFKESAEGQPPSTYDKTLFIDSNGHIGFYCYTDGQYSVKVSSGLSTGTWAYVAGTVDGTNIKAWANGSSASYATGSSYTGYGTPAIAVASLAGTVADSEATRGRFDGDIAEVALWSVALSDGEIVALTSGVSPLLIQPDKLFGYWPLWGNTSPEPNVIGGAADFTLTSAPPKSGHAPMVYPTGQMLQFPAAAPAGGGGTSSKLTLLGVG